MANILIVYSTTDGHTVEICKRILQLVEAENHNVTLVNVADADGLDLQPYDQIMIGASIRYGRHSPNIVRFIERHQATLESKPNAFFSVNVVARKPQKNQPDTNPYMKKFLRRIRWKPQRLAVFAGKLDYPRYNPFDRFMIRLIMWMTRGPTDPNAVIEFTDWQQVEKFAREVAGQHPA